MCGYLQRLWQLIAAIIHQARDVKDHLTVLGLLRMKTEHMLLHLKLLELLSRPCFCHMLDVLVTTSPLPLPRKTRTQAPPELPVFSPKLAALPPSPHWPREWRVTHSGGTGYLMLWGLNCHLCTLRTPWGWLFGLPTPENGISWSRGELTLNMLGLFIYR